MIEEEIEKALDEIFKEDTQTIRERMKSLIKSYDNALNELVENDKKINELQKENTKLKEENITLEGNKIGYKLAMQELRKENGEKETIKIVKKDENAYDVWGIPGTSSYENYKEAATKVSKYIEKLQKENKESKELYNKLLIGYNKLVQEYLELEKENEELKEENQQIKDINVELNTDVSAWKTTTKELQKENKKLKEENKKIGKASDKMYEYISYYGWEDFESNTGCNREKMVDYFYKE